MLKILTRLVSLSLVFGASLPVRRMGYDVHITRAQDWTESAAHPITFDEWKAYIRSDREMRLDNRAQATTTSGETVTTGGPGLAVWVAWKAYIRSDREMRLDNRAQATTTSGETVTT